MKLRFKSIIISALGLFAAMLPAGCIYDDLPLESSEPSELYPEPSLVFDLGLSPFDDSHSHSPGGGYQPGEDWENYIDPSKFRVLFCDSIGNYLFEVDPRFIKVASKKENMWEGDHLAYRVVLPIKELFPAWRDPALNEAIREALYDKGFKVAVLANWPNTVEDTRDIDPETGDEMLGRSTIPTGLDFTWDPTHIAENSHISYLSHCIYDNIYGVKRSGTLPEPYKHLAYDNDGTLARGQMGVYSSWVSYLYTTQAKAAEFIRKGQDQTGNEIEGTVHFTYSYWWEGDKFKYTPYSYTRTVDADNVYSLDNIWRLWNFSAGETCPYHGSNDETKVNPYWSNRNKHVLIKGLQARSNSNLGAFLLTDDDGNEIIQNFCTNAKYVPVDASNNESGFINLPAGVSSAEVTKIITDGARNASSQVTKFKNNSLMIKAYGEGTLRVRAKGSGKIAVITKVPGSTNSESVQYYTIRTDGTSHTGTEPLFTPTVQRGDDFDKNRTWDESAEYIIDPSSKQYYEVYIAAVDGDLDIYEIEYMRARHIFDSARNAIMPSGRNPIPMYGLQNFDAIGAYLLPDHTFNMSRMEENGYLDDLGMSEQKRNYNYRDVYLIRSLAKVELRFKASVFRNHRPEHVMMRVMNRTARCEPMDVINPTDWIWFGNGGLNGYSNQITNPDADGGNFLGIDKEFHNICDYGHLYTPGTTDVDAFRDRISWFYGFWTMDDSGLGNMNGKYHWLNPWDWNNVPGVNLPVTPAEYPRIFNPRIDRSDYCRFHQVDMKDGYYRYVIYLPEKNIDDADSKGNLGARPKVQHVEIRFKNMNSALNYDDDDCYRIYFSNYTENGSKIRETDRTGANSFDSAESNPEFLDRLMPVVRNCHYIFTIESINDEKLGINFSVCGAAKRDYGSGKTITIN